MLSLSAILGSTVTWIITGVLGPIIVRAIPGFWTWLSARPAALAATSGAFAGVVATGLIVTTYQSSHPPVVEGAKLTFRASTQQFNDVRQGAVIPNSANAIFCSLAQVDDDGPDAWCYVYREAEEWKMATGLGGEFNACAVSCLYAEPAT